MSLFRVSGDLDVVPLHCLFDGDKKNEVNKDDTVCGDQVEHLETLGIAVIFALWLIVHFLYQQVAPQV